MEKGIFISDSKEVAEKLNKFFINSVGNLDIEHFPPREDNNTGDNINEIIHKYSLHPSVLKIKEVI